uniref:Uncharacterized protein n=1 Tax=Onchocerca volvulus TaxID=6282 RepID=A0A8R1Y0G4_ONCVO
MVEPITIINPAICPSLEHCPVRSRTCDINCGKKSTFNYIYIV